MLEPLLKVLTGKTANIKHNFIYHDGNHFITTDGFRLHSYRAKILDHVGLAHANNEDWVNMVKYHDPKCPSFETVFNNMLKDAEEYTVTKHIVLLGQVYLPCGRFIELDYLRDALDGRLKPFKYKAHPTDLTKGIVIENDAYSYIIMPLGC